MKRKENWDRWNSNTLVKVDEKDRIEEYDFDIILTRWEIDRELDEEESDDEYLDSEEEVEEGLHSAGDQQKTP